MTTAELADWATAYIRYQERAEGPVSEDDPLFWAVDQFFTFSDENPELCWHAIIEILSRQPCEKVLGMLAAGPLEDLIEFHGPVYIDRIEAAARNDPGFRQLLTGVWESSTPEIWCRVVTARSGVAG